MADLTTLANVKAWLQITDTSLDALLGRLITATSEDFLNEINRPDFMPATDYSERVAAVRFFASPSLFAQAPECFHWPEIWLRHYPINSVTSVTIGDAVIDKVDSLIDRGWWFDDTQTPENRQKVQLIGWDLSCSYSWLGSFWPASDMIVEYNAGYDTVPPAIEQAVIEWVAFKRGQSQLQQMDQTSGSEQIGDYQETGSASELTLAVLTSEIPANVQRVIDQYRRPVI
jgi:hypothetical protein